MYQLGGLFVFNGTTILGMDFVSGVMDTTQSAGRKTLTLLRLFPAAVMIKNEDFFTASETVIGV